MDVLGYEDDTNMKVLFSSGTLLEEIRCMQNIDSAVDGVQQLCHNLHTAIDEAESLLKMLNARQQSNEELQQRLDFLQNEFEDWVAAITFEGQKPLALHNHLEQQNQEALNRMVYADKHRDEVF